MHRDERVEVEQHLEEHNDQKGSETISNCRNCGTCFRELARLDLLDGVH